MNPSSSSTDNSKPRRRFIGALRRFRHSTIDQSALDLPDTHHTTSRKPVPRRKAPRSKSVLIGSKEHWRQSLTERRRQKSLIASERDDMDETTVTDESCSTATDEFHKNKSPLLHDDKTQKFDSWLANVLDDPKESSASPVDDSVSTRSGRSHMSSAPPKGGVARASTILFEPSPTASGRGTSDFLDKFLAKGLHTDETSLDACWASPRKATEAKPMELDFSCIEYSKTRPDSAEFSLSAPERTASEEKQSTNAKEVATKRHQRHIPVYSSAAIAQAKRNKELEEYIADFEQDPNHNTPRNTVQHRRHDGHHGRTISKRPSMLTSSMTQADL